MKKIILLLTAVTLFTFGYFLKEKFLTSSRLALPNGYSAAKEAKSSKNRSKVDLSLKKVLVTEQTEDYLVSQALPPKQALFKPYQEVPLNRKTEFTPAELKQLEKARKHERRQQGYVKSDMPDKYAEFQKMIRTKEGTQAPAYKANYKLTELYAAQQVSAALQMSAQTNNLSWSERGPTNVPGRTRGLLTHPDNPQRIWFAGSVAGGIWKTTDAGVNWKNKTPDLPNLATTTLAMARSNPDVIYAGTGEGFFNADPKLSKRNRFFFAHLISLLASFRGRFHFMNLSRYARLHEVTYRQRFSQAFAFMAFNQALVTAHCSKERIIKQSTFA